MKKVYGIIFIVFLGIHSLWCAVEQKTTDEIASSLFTSFSSIKAKDSVAILIDNVKNQSKEYGIDEKEVVKLLIKKVDSSIISYQNHQEQPKNEFFDSTRFLILGTVGTLSSLFYYFSQDTAENEEKGHFFGPQDLQKDSKTGGVFISNYILKNAVQAGRTKDDAFKGIVISGIALSWGMLLRAKEWYEANCYKKNLALRNELEEYLSTL